MLRKILLWLLKDKYELIHKSRIKVYRSNFAVTNTEVEESGELQTIISYYVKQKSIEMIEMMVKDGVITLKREDVTFDDTIKYRLQIYALKTGGLIK